MNDDTPQPAPLRPSLALVAAQHRTDGTPRVGGGPTPDIERLEAVEALWRARRPTAAIAREIAERFGVSERTVDADLARVRAVYKAPPEQRAALRDQHRATLLRLFDQAELEGDMRLARDLLADLAKLDGVCEPDRVEHSGAIHTGVLVVAQQPLTAEEWRAQYGAPVEVAPDPQEIEPVTAGEEVPT